MIAIKCEEETELRIGLLWFMLIYPIHFYDPIFPKVAHTEHNHYWISIADTLGLSSAEKKKHFTVGQKKGLIGISSPPNPHNPLIN